MSLSLNKNPVWKDRRGPVVLIIMDGLGYGKYIEGDAVAAADLRCLRSLEKSCPHVKLKAHGKAVGLPSDEDMGNSEVGHNAIGCGRVFAQGAKLVNASISSGAMFKGSTWKKLIKQVLDSNGTLHFIGLLSDGNVHSHINHLKAMIAEASNEGVKKLRIHTLLDGRDVSEQSSLDFIEPFETFLSEFSNHGCDYRIASGGGRQYITMDRYGADWSMVERGWNTHVLGEGKRFNSAKEAILYYRSLKPSLIDQDMHEFVIEENGNAIGTIEDGDSVIFFNFRGDRALEMSAAFEEANFKHFDRKRWPKVLYSGMMEYDGDLKVPKMYLVEPPAIDRTMGEYLIAEKIPILAMSETQKYGHVTYFFNGNRQGKFSEELEDYVEIPSDLVPFEQRPWMKCAEITDRLIKELASGKHSFIRINFPNGDMVGHTGVYQAVVCGLEGMDIQISRIKEAIKEVGGILVLSADHGNSDDMFEHDKKTGEVLRKENGDIRAKTSHSLNPVPCIIYDPEYKGEYKPILNEGLGISSLAATCIELLGFLAPDDYDKSVLSFG